LIALPRPGRSSGVPRRRTMGMFASRRRAGRTPSPWRRTRRRAPLRSGYISACCSLPESPLPVFTVWTFEAEIAHSLPRLYCVGDLPAGRLADVAAHVDYEYLVGQVDLAEVQFVEAGLLLRRRRIDVGVGVAEPAHAQDDPPFHRLAVVGLDELL